MQGEMGATIERNEITYMKNHKSEVLTTPHSFYAIEPLRLTSVASWRFHKP